MSNRKHLDSISFRNLVKEIDAKWGHTYEPSANIALPIEELLEEINVMKSEYNL